jgi:3-methylcrotonyl-CoA carboxylase alpha subunit
VFSGELKAVNADTIGLEAQSNSVGSVKSPMFSKLSSINVKDGQKVLKNDIILVVEAMKMEHALRAPKDGIVKLTDGLTVGDMVPEGKILLTID